MEIADNLKTQTAHININGAINKTFLNRHPHELCPGHNLHNLPNVESCNPDVIAASCQRFPYAASLPTPMLFPECPNKALSSYVTDPALQIVLDKEQWFKQKRKMRKIWKEDKALSRHCSIQSKAETSCPRFLVDFTELLSSDPDPNFHSTYNWYYTDGTLNIVDDNGSEILIHCSGIDDTFLHATPITKSKNRYKVSDALMQSTIKLPDKKPIFQIISSKRNNDPLLIGIRQKKSFLLCYFSSEDRTNEITYLQKVPGNNAITSAALEDTCHNLICLADTDDNLDVYDINTLNELRSINLPKDDYIVDKWSSVKYYDPYTLVSVNRKSIHTVDLRTDDGEISVYRPHSISDKCDEMSLFKFSRFHRNLLYVGTNHSLFSYDIRMLKEFQPLQRWTHGMKSVPHLMDLGQFGDNEVIIFSTPLANEIRLIINCHMKNVEDEISNTNEIIVQSPCLPWQPPSLADSLLLSQTHGEALKPNKYLKERMHFCTSGISTISKDESIHLFIQNTFGDVFQQQIKTVDNQFDNSDVPKALSDWIENIDSGISPLFATNLINLKPILSILKSDTSKCDIPKKKVKENWRRPLSELAEYRDVLAADLLSAWNLSDDKGDDIPSQLHKNSTTSEEKVSAWLQSAPVGENNPLNIFMNENLENLNSSYNFMSQPVISNTIFEPMITSSQPITRPKKNVQKQKHFEGF